MIKWFLFVFCLSLFSGCQSAGKRSVNCLRESSQRPIVCQLSDSSKIQLVLAQYANSSELSTAELVAETAKQFLGIPYVSHTLEHGATEPLTVEVDGLDCTTFVETALALARTIKSGEPEFDQFANQLETIRYRDGKRDGYPSRLHYFSDWIFNNQQYGLVSQPAAEFGKPLDIEVNFMSTHPNSYEVLKDNPELVKTIANQERAISARDYFYLPKSEFASNEKCLKTGDIIGIVTSINGLDVAHTGILLEVGDRIHLMHASTLSNQVIISEQPFSEILQGKKSYLGVIVARPMN
ncbi:N-acetylmuramoyl-L-alanine amidase-like domain-containing protein [uncultured Sunxiuqinia sp.]|uniref:N-acetylmuramoyl-L-alanine amidase-like domain-containing protein n=1 Tax=uncultured Sunxiuqinia sp. TaxID=1573825 RepID=UPI002AA67D7A|nr:N-acetylmuramoyl-L-alanine amidase-like domain-containing protein [uncultured Sunxiuqinia sp.]